MHRVAASGGGGNGGARGGRSLARPRGARARTVAGSEVVGAKGRGLGARGGGESRPPGAPIEAAALLLLGASQGLQVGDLVFSPPALQRQPRSRSLPIASFSRIGRPSGSSSLSFLSRELSSSLLVEAAEDLQDSLSSPVLPPTPTPIAGSWKKLQPRKISEHGRPPTPRV